MHIRRFNKSSSIFAILLLGIYKTAAQTNTAGCFGQSPSNLTSKYGAARVTAPGWTSQLAFQDIVRPRSIVLGPSGELLVLSQGVGIMKLEGANCLDEAIGSLNMSTMWEDKELNHGLQLSSDGKTLYASTNDALYAWSYSQDFESLSTGTTILTGMKGGGHVTRTILLSKKVPGWLVVSHGSDGNLDSNALGINTGSSQVKAFYIGNMTDSSPSLDYVRDGILLGAGLRNSVGLAEEPSRGEIIAVENSADDIERDGVDIHENNPGEELNFLGQLPTSPGNANTAETPNYGYPTCFALWDTNIPNPGNLKVGSHFALTTQGKTNNDAWCESETIKPRLTFQPHNAPLDIKFNKDGSTAYVAFHGSWNSPDPVGYKVSSIAFKDGEPVDASDSTTAAKDLFTNGDPSKCPGDCFRPAGLAVDHERDRIWVTSDATGEVWILSRTSTTDANPTDASPTAPLPVTSSQVSGASGLRTRLVSALAAIAIFVFVGCL